MAAAQDPLEQAAAIPIRCGRVCLISSSSGKRWIVPKGSIEAGDGAEETALREAWEEAGLTGVLYSEPVGSYCFEKYGRLCRVTVFLLEVQQAAADWPEAAWRQRWWLPGEQAADLIHDRGLRKLLRRVAATAAAEVA